MTATSLDRHSSSASVWFWHGRRSRPPGESTPSMHLRLQLLIRSRRGSHLATGSERSALHQAAGRCELLRSIGSGASLGLFALGLARYSSDTTQEDEFFDRLGSRDRAGLRRVKTTAGAIKLTARLLMETGRTAEAVQLLDPLIEAADTERSASQRAPIDREAAWLLSRAALQLDLHDRADELLALAGDFGTSEAALPEPAPFVGSRRCGTAIRGSAASNNTKAAMRRRCDSVRASNRFPFRRSPSPTR